MTYTIARERKNAIAMVGVEVFDTHMYFVSMQSKPSGSETENMYVPETYGNVGITFDAVENGNIINKTRVLESLKKIQAQTQASAIVFSSWYESRIDAQWQELARVAGFTESISVAREYVLSARLPSQESYVLYFLSEQLAQVMHGGVVLREVAYPLDVESILFLQDLVESDSQASMYVTGNMPQSDMVAALADYSIEVLEYKVWRGCFNVSEYIPSLHKEKTGPYAVAISLTYCAGQYEFQYHAPEDAKSGEASTDTDHSLRNIMEKLESKQESTTENTTPTPKEAEDTVHTNQTENTVSQETNTRQFLPRLKTVFLPTNKQVRTKEKTHESIRAADTSNDPLGQATPHKAQQSIWLQDADKLIASLIRSSKK